MGAACCKSSPADVAEGITQNKTSSTEASGFDHGNVAPESNVAVKNKGAQAVTVTADTRSEAPNSYGVYYYVPGPEKRSTERAASPTRKASTLLPISEGHEMRVQGKWVRASDLIIENEQKKASPSADAIDWGIPVPKQRSAERAASPTREATTPVPKFEGYKVSVQGKQVLACDLKDEQKMADPDSSSAEVDRDRGVPLPKHRLAFSSTSSETATPAADVPPAAVAKPDADRETPPVPPETRCKPAAPKTTMAQKMAKMWAVRKATLAKQLSNLKARRSAATGTNKAAETGASKDT